MNKNGYYFFDLSAIETWMADHADSTVIEDLLKDPTAPHDVKGLVKVMLDLNAGKLTKPVMLTYPKSAYYLPTFAVMASGDNTLTFPHQLWLSYVAINTGTVGGAVAVQIANNRQLQIAEI